MNDPILPSNCLMGSLTGIYMSNFSNVPKTFICFGNTPIVMILYWYQEYQNLQYRSGEIFEQPKTDNIYGLKVLDMPHIF